MKKGFSFVFLALFVCGCSAIPKVGGIDLHLGTHEHGLWYDSDEREYNPNGFGIKLSVLYGKLVDPYSKLGENPWKGDKPVFVLRSPFIIFPYISVALGEYGFYLGVKPYKVYEPYHTSPERYGLWWKDEVGTEADPAEFLTFTASMRTTRWK